MHAAQIPALTKSSKYTGPTVATITEAPVIAVDLFNTTETSAGVCRRVGLVRSVISDVQTCSVLHACSTEQQELRCLSV